MAYGYMRSDSAEQFREAGRYDNTLITVAMEEGFTREEAIELLKVYGLSGINSELIKGSY